MFAQESVLLFLLVTLAGLTNTTEVKQCRVTKIEPPTSQDIQITGCDDDICRLQKGTEPSVNLLIKPEIDVNDLIIRAHAELIANIPFPFLGVEGTSACGHIFSEDGKNNVSCPLKAGQTYLYKHSFKILPIYPNVRLTILWGLVDKDTKKYIACFEVPAKIVN